MIKILEEVLQKAWELGIEVSEVKLTEDQYSGLLNELNASKIPNLKVDKLNLEYGQVKILQKEQE